MSTHLKRMKDESLPFLIFGILGAICFMVEFFFVKKASLFREFIHLRLLFMGISVGVMAVMYIFVINLHGKFADKLLTYAIHSFKFAWDCAALQVGFFMFATIYELTFEYRSGALFILLIVIILYIASYSGYYFAINKLPAKIDSCYNKSLIWV